VYFFLQYIDFLKEKNIETKSTLENFKQFLFYFFHHKKINFILIFYNDKYN